MNKDMTVGKPETVLWQFCMPLFGSIIFQQLYNIADSLIAGKYIGENALAAVGNSYEITLIFIAFAYGSNMGCSVLVAQLFGAKRFSDMKTAINTAFVSIAVLLVVLMSFGFLFGGSLLELINTPISIFDDSKLYLDIYILGLPFLFFYNISTGIFSALGDSKTPFIFLAASSVSNIAIDILFVAVFQMGVTGVAWATFLCQGVSCILAVLFIFRRLSLIKMEEKSVLFSGEALRNIVIVAVPGILQQSSISIGNIILQGVINGFGASVIAGYAAAVKLNNLVITSLTTLGNGISNYVAQNIGAGKMERVRAGFLAGVKIVLIICIPIIVLYWLGAEKLVLFFMDKPSEQALNTGIQFLRIVSLFYFVVAVKLVFDGVLRGAQMMKLFMIATCADLLVRVILALVLSSPFGITGVWSAWPFGWGTSFVLAASFYRKGPWIVKETRNLRIR